MATTITTPITIDPTSMESLAAAIRSGITTPELLAGVVPGSLIEGCLVLDSQPVCADDGYAEVVYDADTTPDEAAQEYVASGDWGDIQTTIWITVYTYRYGIDAEGQIVRVERERGKISLDPTEPACIDGEGHDWQSPVEIVGGIKENPGCFGHGGGVIYYECCLRCGCGRTTNTWAQDMTDGEQGLESVSYEPRKYKDDLPVEDAERARADYDV